MALFFGLWLWLFIYVLTTKVLKSKNLFFTESINKGHCFLITFFFSFTTCFTCAYQKSVPTDWTFKLTYQKLDSY